MYYFHTISMAKTPTIRRITSKGQVTLPASWRARMGNHDTIVFVERGNILEVHPAEIVVGEEVLFDAVRDTKGVGIPVSKLITALKKDLAQ